MLNPDQYGFRKHRSTTAKILRSIDQISIKLAKNQPFDSIQLDLSKAFDKLSIAKLIEAAMNIGISGKLLSWLKAYLTGRTLSVKVEDTYSREIPMKSGVPQGSVLGPILFLIAVNGLPNNCPERELLLAFADDSELGDEANKPEKLQSTLTNYNDSCKMLGLQLNAEKCEILHYGANNPLNGYTIEGIELPTVDSTRDLGVTRSTDNKPNLHINSIIKKGNNMFRFFLASFVDRSQKTVLKVYKTYIRSILDYASPSWNPHYATIVVSLERLQKRVVNIIDDINQDLPYSEKLKILKLYSLQRRRERYDLCFLWKYLNSGSNYLSITKTPESTTPRNARHHYHLTDVADLKNHDKLKSIRSHTYVPRVVELWNLLPGHIVRAKTIDSFKKHLDIYIGDITDKPLPDNINNLLTIKEAVDKNMLLATLRTRRTRDDGMSSPSDS